MNNDKPPYRTPAAVYAEAKARDVMSGDLEALKSLLQQLVWIAERAPDLAEHEVTTLELARRELESEVNDAGR